jgi:hypothetical protein
MLGLNKSKLDQDLLLLKQLQNMKIDHQNYLHFQHFPLSIDKARGTRILVYKATLVNSPI